MAKDIKLDLTTHDLSFSNFDLELTTTKEESLQQRLTIKLKTFLEEWVFNVLWGVPYFQKIFVKGISKSQIDSIYKGQILSTPDVITISSFESSIDPASREYTMTFSVTNETGDEVLINL